MTQKKRARTTYAVLTLNLIAGKLAILKLIVIDPFFAKSGLKRQ